MVAARKMHLFFLFLIEIKKEKERRKEEQNQIVEKGKEKPVCSLLKKNKEVQLTIKYYVWLMRAL